MAMKNESEWKCIIQSYEEMAAKNLIKNELVNSALIKGLKTPTEMQFRVFLASKTGFNVLVETKINSEVLLLVSLITSQRACESDVLSQSIVLTPNCKLANGMESLHNSLFSTSKVNSRVCSTQSTLKDDIEAVTAGVHIIIGTVGRIYDLISIGAIASRDIKVCVILDYESFDSVEIDDVLTLFPDSVQRFIFCTDLSSIPLSLKGIKIKSFQSETSKDYEFVDRIGTVDGYKEESNLIQAKEAEKCDFAKYLRKQTMPVTTDMIPISNREIMVETTEPKLSENEDIYDTQQHELSIKDGSIVFELKETEKRVSIKDSFEETKPIVSGMISISNPEMLVEMFADVPETVTFQNKKISDCTATEHLLLNNEDTGEYSQSDEDLLRRESVSPIVKDILQEILELMQSNENKVTETENKCIEKPEEPCVIDVYNVASIGQIENETISSPNSESHVSKRKRKKSKSKQKLEKLNFKSINMYYVMVDKYSSKVDTLQWLLKTLSVKNAVIYCNDKTGLILETIFYKHGTKVFPLFGPISYKDGRSLIKLYLKTEECILIASDKFCEIIVRKPEALTINFDFPYNERFFLKRLTTQKNQRLVEAALSLLTFEEHKYFEETARRYNFTVKAIENKSEPTNHRA